MHVNQMHQYKKNMNGSDAFNAVEIANNISNLKDVGEVELILISFLNDVDNIKKITVLCILYNQTIILFCLFLF